MRLHQIALAVLIAATATVSAQYYPAKLDKNLVNRHPYNKIGRLDFGSNGGSYIGSGVVVTPKGVLTCAHNLYDATGGFSTRVRFTRARNGRKNKGRSTARALYILADYPNYDSESDPGFSRDLGGARFSNNLANGGSASVTLNPSKFSEKIQKEILGYGSDFHSGSFLLSLRTRSRFFTYFNSFLGSNNFYTEAGMSGGPVLIRQKGKLRVYGITVSGGGGTRALDRDYYPIYLFLRGQ